MNILRFVEEFPDEQSCIIHFKTCREQEGVFCKKCNSSNHYWLQNKLQWECKSCKFRTTLRSGTIMHGSNLKFRIWYLAMAFMSFSKKGISAKELQRQKNVAVMAESIPLTNENGNNYRHPGYFKMKVLTSHLKSEINQVVQDNFDQASIVFSDKSTSYVNISNFVEAHLTQKSDKSTTKETLK